MAKTSVDQWDEIASNNTDIGGTNIDEGCAPSGINNAIRAVMAQIKAWFKSSVFRIWDGTDPTKRAAFDLSGISTGTTRTLKIPDASGTIALSDDPWASQPIGVPVPLVSSLTGASAPPTNQAYRYIKLTASDAYNTGVLTSESVSGTAPLVVATAVISAAGSPINGRTVNLINTERRFLRGGSAGTAENDMMQGHIHTGGATGLVDVANSGTPNRFSYSAASTGAPSTDGTNGTPRTGLETRPKNIGVDYYMRIK